VKRRLEAAGFIEASQKGSQAHIDPRDWDRLN
jgi:predicted RNA binding protein YcfA (HicA-like mRNA interferase family)